MCINQADDDERSHQVEQMRDIYAGAVEVFSWLGEPDHEMKFALDFIMPSVDLDVTWDPELEVRGWSDFDKFVDKALELHQSTITAGLVKLLDFPYWHRMWILQELVVSTDEPILVCGHFKVSIQRYFAWLSRIRYVDDDLLHDERVWSLQNLMDFRSSWRCQVNDAEVPEPLHLFRLLVATVDRQASDPRDHIFSLMGLLPPSQHTVAVNYKRSCSIVFQQAMVEALQTSGDLRLLTYSIDDEKTVPVPSWCIDFSTAWNTSLAVIDQQLNDVFRPNVAGSEMGLSYDFSNGRLKVQAINLDSVDYTLTAALSKQLCNNLSIDSVFDSLYENFRTVRDTAFLHFAALAATAIAGETRFGFETEEYSFNDIPWDLQFEEIPDIAYESAGVGDERPLLPFLCNNSFDITKLTRKADISACDTQGVPTWVARFIYEYWDLVVRTQADCISDLVLVKTARGHIGRTSANVEVGDAIYAFAGCETPAVLRPHPDDTFTLMSFTQPWHVPSWDDKSQWQSESITLV